MLAIDDGECAVDEYTEESWTGRPMSQLMTHDTDDSARRITICKSWSWSWAGGAEVPGGSGDQESLR